MKIRYLTLAVALGLSGCSLIPEYQQPASPVADAWPQGAAYAGAEPIAAGAMPLDRRTFFQNPQLQQLLDLALENNRDLPQAALNVAAYRTLYCIQPSDLLHSIGLHGSAHRHRPTTDLTHPAHS